MILIVDVICGRNELAALQFVGFVGVIIGVIIGRDGHTWLLQFRQHGGEERIVMGHAVVEVDFYLQVGEVVQA